MSTKGTALRALTLLLLVVSGCDKGGTKLSVEPTFQGTVRGVVSANQTTLPGVTVRLTGSVVRDAQTTASGSFSFPGLPEGSYVVAISGFPEDVEFTTTSKSASLSQGQASATLDFSGIVRRDGAISGTVQVEGTGLAGASVTLSGPESRTATTDGQGAFAFSQLRRGTYSATLSGFDPAFYAFSVLQQEVQATGASEGEVHFSGTLVPQPPAAPTALAASATGSTTIDLSWVDASDDETRFEVERKEGAEGSWATVGAPDPNSASFADMALTPNTTYTYRVRSCSDAGCSGYSNEASATTDDVPPDSPADLVATASGPYSVGLEWSDASANETRFEVERKTQPAGDWEAAGSAVADASALQDGGLTPATTYTYRVRACNDVGCSAPSGEATATTDQIPPEAPTGLTASATGSTTASLGWTDASDNESRFEVERKDGPGGSWFSLGTTAEDATTLADSGLTPNTLYTYRIRACNDAGCSAYSAEATLTTEEVPPSAPTALSALATGPNTVDLTWTDESSNEGRFEVERKLGAMGSWGRVATPGPNLSSMEDDGLLPASTYTYRVRACNDVGCSAYSNEAAATTPDIPPEAPSSMSASPQGPTTVDLSWTDESDNETEFRVERKEGAGGSWGEIATRGAGVTTYGDSGLTPSTTYFYRVRACNAQGCSSYSGEADATTTVMPPASPSGLGATATGTASIQLTWTDNAGDEINVKVERKTTAGGSYSQIATLPANSVSYGDSGLSSNTTYFYRVSACNAGGCSAPSNEDDATTWDVPPAAPTSLTATATGGTTIDVGWTDNSGNETGFRVQRKEGAAGTYSTVATRPANATSYSDSGLSLSTTYYYRVVAFNGSGDSPPSNEDDATTWAGTGPNLSISAMYLTQSTQTLAGEVPLVAGRDGILRVFAVASEANTFQPDVRIRFYSGGSLVHTEVVSASLAATPLAVDESTLNASWNVAVAGALIQPGLSILADVDPTDAIAEPLEGDNDFPVGGTPLAMDVRSVSSLDLTFIPVRQSVNGLVGNVSAGNVAQFLDVTMRMLPIAQADAQIHAEYVTAAPALESGNGNGAWSTILSEIATLRVTEGSSRQYYGVVATSYSSGVAGMGYIGWPAAIGWDKLPSGSGVAAHEWGHNWNLRHAPGCGAGNPDPAFPHADGKIGVWGMDVGAWAMKSPASYYDFMTYCNPDWVSDYFYKKIMDYRDPAPIVLGSGEPEPSLLVWGRVEGGRVVLEPAFEIETVPVLPSGSGDFYLEAVDGSGNPSFSMSFSVTPFSDGAEEDGHFAFAIPLRLLDSASLHELRVTGRGHTPAVMHSRVGPELVAPAEPTLTSRGGSAVELTWDGSSFPMALVRDPATGEVLSFARNGGADLHLTSDEVEIIFSDGLKSSRRLRHRMK